MRSRFKSRSSQAEIMDDLHCAGEVVNQTLREITVINRKLGGDHVTLHGLQYLLRTNRPERKIAIADLGCGGGDILNKIADWGMKNGLDLELTGIDANPNIIAFAQQNSTHFTNIHYETVNILSPEFRRRKFDVVLATLFAHHFSDDQLADLLKSLCSQAQIGIVINDIHRHWLAYHSIRILTKLFSKSAMVKFDAPLSVLRAFTRSEWESILKRAGIAHYSLRWNWAFRWQLVIASPPAV